MTENRPSNHHDHVHAPRLAAAPMPPALTQRLDAVDAALGEATAVAHSLVDRLEPVLPLGFGQESLPAKPSLDGPPTATSPLAARLEDLASRGQGLILHLRRVVDAVDL